MSLPQRPLSTWISAQSSTSSHHSSSYPRCAMGTKVTFFFRGRGTLGGGRKFKHSSCVKGTTAVGRLMGNHNQQTFDAPWPWVSEQGGADGLQHSCPAVQGQAVPCTAVTGSRSLEIYAHLTHFAISSRIWQNCLKIKKLCPYVGAENVMKN